MVKGFTPGALLVPCWTIKQTLRNSQATAATIRWSLFFQMCKNVGRTPEIVIMVTRDPFVDEHRGFKRVIRDHCTYGDNLCARKHGVMNATQKSVWTQNRVQHCVPKTTPPSYLLSRLLCHFNGSFRQLDHWTGQFQVMQVKWLSAQGNIVPANAEFPQKPSEARSKKQ
jgi:hypothetical protein